MAQPLNPPSDNSGGGGFSGGTSVPGSNANVIQNSFTVNSGLFDQTASQYPIQFLPGIPQRSYQYFGPLVNLTDTFTGTLGLLHQLGANAPTSTTLTFAGRTLDQIAASINSGFGAFAFAIVIKIGTSGYLIIVDTNSGINPAATQDGVLTLTTVALSDDQDPNLNIQFVPFTANTLGLQSTGTYKWAVGIRDQVTGHVSNMSPVASVSEMLYPSAAALSIQAPVKFENQNQVLEVYRTAVNGSSLLFLGLATWTGGNVYTFNDHYPDSFLNPSIVGPIAEANDPPPQGIFGLVAHSGSLWGIVDNKVYFSGGPDTVNGSGNEAWPPSNFFAFPGQVVALLPTATGLLVFLKDDIHIIRGVDSSSYYPDMWLAGFGVSNPQAATYDGQTLYVYTTKQQLHALSPSNSHEIGFDVGDILSAAFPATTTNLTLHRGTSLDYALYVSNGTDTILRYEPRQKLWSPKSKPLMGAGRVRSLETSTAVNTLLLSSPASKSPGIFNRNLSVWADDGAPFTCFSTIGTMMVAEPGAVANFEYVAMQLRAVGSIPSIFVLNNEIDSTVVPFTQVFRPVPDPPDLEPSKTLIARRWYLKASQSPIPMIVNTVQVKVAFPAENAQNEVLGLYLRNHA